MLIVLAMAYGCVMLDQYLRSESTRLFDFTLIRITMWAEVLFNLITIGAVIFLFWLVATRTSRSRIVGVTFLVVGIFLATYYVLGWSLAPSIQLITPIYFDAALAPNSVFSHAAAGIAIIGLFILILSRSRVVDHDKVATL